jgi:Tfp pilus assembly protein PilX
MVFKQRNLICVTVLALACAGRVVAMDRSTKAADRGRFAQALAEALARAEEQEASAQGVGAAQAQCASGNGSSSSAQENAQERRPCPLCRYSNLCKQEGH